jgi:ABC-type multidrug transport system fused ATPase/permease subunit
LKLNILNFSLLNLLMRLWRQLSVRRRFQFLFLFGLMLVNAFAEVISLGIILPFLGILIAPEKVFNHPMVAEFMPIFGINSSDQLVLPLTIAFVLSAMLAGIIRLFLLWVNTRLALASGTDISVEVYRRTLYQPYWVHTSRNSSDVISSIISKVDIVVYKVLQPLTTLIISSVLQVAITLTLFAIDPQVALITGVFFGVCYVLIARLAHYRLNKNSQCIAQEQTRVMKALREGLGGIRDVLLNGVQEVYCDIYRNADYPLRKAQSSIIFISSSPRCIMEALGIVFIAILAYLISLDGGVARALPVLGVIVLGAQRLLPTLQHSYGSWVSLVGSQVSLSAILDLLEQPIQKELLQAYSAPLYFESSIRFKDVRFRYSSLGTWVLNGLNLTIPKGSRMAFVGSTGSGKSTTLDLLMGLLQPTEGELLVDDHVVTKSQIRPWQQLIAHVPQNIYLADSTVAENIAFGELRGQIDMQRVKQVARQAQISDFIESLTERYNSFVGERGIALSGGQRQRIGIARALYKEASVLIFDEATNALDGITEKSVMAAIEGLDSNLTVLFVAHRIGTIRHCDAIIEIAQGRVVAQGTYEQLINNSSSFRQLVHAAEL